MLVEWKNAMKEKRGEPPNRWTESRDSWDPQIPLVHVALLAASPKICYLYILARFLNFLTFIAHSLTESLNSFIEYRLGPLRFHYHGLNVHWSHSSFREAYQTCRRQGLTFFVFFTINHIIFCKIESLFCFKKKIHNFL